MAKQTGVGAAESPRTRAILDLVANTLEQHGTGVYPELRAKISTSVLADVRMTAAGLHSGQTFGAVVQHIHALTMHALGRMDFPQSRLVEVASLYGELDCIARTYPSS